MTYVVILTNQIDARLSDILYYNDKIGQNLMRNELFSHQTVTSIQMLEEREVRTQVFFPMGSSSSSFTSVPKVIKGETPDNDGRKMIWV